jgi:hypothetical protein
LPVSPFHKSTIFINNINNMDTLTSLDRLVIARL